MSVVELEEYLGKCIGMEEMMRTGYAQKGYESILRFDTWKDQKCACHTQICSERIDEVPIRVGGDVKVSRLRGFVEAMEAAGVEEVDVDASDLSGSDCCEVYGSLTLHSTRTYEAPKSDIVYKMEYYDYVRQLHARNVAVWEAYRKANGLDARAIEEKKMYLTLRAKYGKEFGHV